MCRNDSVFDQHITLSHADLDRINDGMRRLGEVVVAALPRPALV